ncbi:zinc ABC transporter substrate-binding protein AztC [Actinophytocola glycyrrhizae]|uniref:Zinc ABC transporter substrate-binding protein AztC n=1 Tax=Actinophytocola glycyrrhizae TaxID=2044873 RepID=A0ABV9RSB1_9PSEU
MRILVTLTVLLLVLAGCTGSAPDRPSVVVTTNILGDLIGEIVGDEAELTVLMGPNADPHSFAISAQQAARLEQADLVVHNGLGLEEGVRRNVEAAETSLLAVGEHVGPIRYAEGDAAGQPDPHFWTDPARVRTAVEVIAEHVTRIGGVDAAAVRANADAYLARLDDLDTWMSAEFARLPPQRRKLVTNHHVFGYLAQRYDFQVVGAVVPSGTTLASPSAADLASLADAIRAAGVPAIFADSSQPDRLARVLAEQAGVDVTVVPLFSESLTEPGGGAGTYLELMRANTEAIVTGLTQ